jgi:endo-beta-N-acetylglucosaminidase D
LRLLAKKCKTANRTKNNESLYVGQEALPEVQDHQAAWPGYGHLLESETQAAPGLN